MKRVAIITPTIGENLGKLFDSIAAQALPQNVELHHVVVGDGYGITGREPVGHHHMRYFLTIPGDQNGLGCGAAPRAFGSVYAVDRLRCHAIGFLDADNWLHERHVELMLRVGAERPDCDALVARRVIVTHDTGEPIDDHPPDQNGLVHHGPGGAVQPFVDTNCVWLQNRGVLLGRDWVSAMRFPESGDGYDVDAPISVVEDRLFWAHVCRALRHSAFPAPMAPVPTVYYRSVWLDSYTAANAHQRPPYPAKVIDAEGNLLKVGWRVIEKNDGHGPRFQSWQLGVVPPVPPDATLVDDPHGTVCERCRVRPPGPPPEGVVGWAGDEKPEWARTCNECRAEVS